MRKNRGVQYVFFRRLKILPERKPRIILPSQEYYNIVVSSRKNKHYIMV